jgi:FAD/FMN-containing dehydrogenase
MPVSIYSIFQSMLFNHLKGGRCCKYQWWCLDRLELFKNITVNAESNTIEAGPANTWFNMASALEPYGQIVIGGRLKTIGIAGLTIGGGLHYFVNKYGFVMGNAIGYDVATADGKIVTATAIKNTDLFWAMKGGGSNFGIVTKFTYRTFDIPQVSSTIMSFNESAVPAFCKAAVDLAKLKEDEPIAAGGIITISYNPTTKVVSPSVLGLQEGATLEPSHFANFSAIANRTINNITTAAYWSSTLDTPYQVSR